MVDYDYTYTACNATESKQLKECYTYDFMALDNILYKKKTYLIFFEFSTDKNSWLLSDILLKAMCNLIILTAFQNSWIISSVGNRNLWLRVQILQKTI